MKDSAGVSKGYAFVRFMSKEAARKAQKERNGTMLQGKRIGVTPSADQDTLFLGNLRKEWGRQELEDMVLEAFQDVISVELAMPPNTGSPLNKKQQNRGFAFVHFATHAAAARAFRMASKPEFMLGGKWRPAVDWAENEPDPDPEEMLKVKTAFVGNLPSTVKEDFLRSLFEPYGKIERVAVSRKGNSPVGFVHFVQRPHVEAAIKALDGKLVGGPNQGPTIKLQVQDKPVDTLGRGRTVEYGQLIGSKGTVREGKLQALGPVPTSRLSVSDSYDSLALAHPSGDMDCLGFDAYGNYSLNSLAALPSLSSGILCGQPIPSRISTVVPEAYGLTSFRRTPSLGNTFDAGGLSNTLDTGSIQRRPFKFDPYTGEPFKFDPFTGEPLHVSTMTTLQPSTLALQPSPAAMRLGGQYL